MNYSKYRFNLDMQSYISQISLPVRQYDTGIVLRINLTDGGIPYTIRNGCRAVFYARKADGNPLMNDCVIEKNTTICYELTQQTTACSGVVDCEVRLYGTDGNLITTPRFILVVDSRVVHDDDFPLSEAEQTILDNIIISEAKRVSAEELRVAAEAEREQTREEMLASTQKVNETTADIEQKLANGEFIGPKGNKGDTGDAGVYVGSETPADPDVGVWVNPLGDEAEVIVGESAYDIAVRNGFKGTEQEWLISLKGKQGEKGEDFIVSEVYSSVAEMNAGYATDGVKVGGFVVIETGNVNDEDNAKLYIKGNTAYEYLTDLSGAQGMKGVAGKSAYQIALDNGFEGTEQEWLESLKGKDGEGSSIEIVQETGDREDAVMSQKAVTDIIDPLGIEVDASKNLFNKEAVSEVGQWVAYNTGNREYYPTNQYISAYFTSDNIPVQAGKTYTYSGGGKYVYTSLMSYAIFTTDGAYITGAYPKHQSANPYKLTMPANAGYIVFNFHKDDTLLDTLQFELGEEATDYESYGWSDVMLSGVKIRSSQIVGDNILLHLPKKYSLVVGDTFELFYKGFMLCKDPYRYDIRISCDMGNSYFKRYIVTPNTTHIGTHKLTVSVYDRGVLVESQSVDLIVKAKATSPASPRNILCVGDSLLAGGEWAAESFRRLTASNGTPVGDGLSNINYIGTCEKNGVKFEGYGGWTFESYNTANKSNQFLWITCTHDKADVDQHSIYKDSNGNTWKLETIENNRIKIICNNYSPAMLSSGTLTWVSGGTNHSNITYTAAEQASGNPFWNEAKNAVDFANYATKLGVTSIDYCYVLLGWNSSNTATATIKSQVQTIITNLHTAFPNCQIVLLGLEVPSLDGIGVNYACRNDEYSWHWYKKTEYVFNLDKLYAEIAEENTNVTSINISGQFDTENNMLTSQRTVNARNSTVETYQSNGVHPATSGYYQIADACYRDIVHKLQV